MKAIDLPYDFEPRDYQRPLWDALAVGDCKRAITVWPRRNGKDLTAVNVLTVKAFQRVGLYLYVAPYQVQARSIIWTGMDGGGRPFLDYIPKELVAKKLNQQMEVHLVNGSIIRILGSDNPDALVGTNPVGIIFTEYSLHKDQVWDYLRPILAENGGWALFNGTPRGMNHFHKMFHSALENDNWFTQYLTAADTGYPSAEEIDEERKSGMAESLIEQEFYVSWNASSEEVCIPLDIIQPAIHSTLHPQDYSHEQVVIGVDVAYAAKGDRAVIARRQGRKLFPMESYQGMDNMTFASRVVDHINRYNVDLCFIDAGRGEGVISRLEQLGYGSIVYPVNFGGTKEVDAMYSNKSTEMWVRTRDWFLKEANPDIPNDETLIRDLSCPMLDLSNDKGKVAIESKKSRKTRGYASTDFADAVVLTHAEDMATFSMGHSSRLIVSRSL